MLKPTFLLLTSLLTAATTATPILTPIGGCTWVPDRTNVSFAYFAATVYDPNAVPDSVYWRVPGLDLACYTTLPKPKPGSEAAALDLTDISCKYPGSRPTPSELHLTPGPYEAGRTATVRFQKHVNCVDSWWSIFYVGIFHVDCNFVPGEWGGWHCASRRGDAQVNAYHQEKISYSEGPGVPPPP